MNDTDKSKLIQELQLRTALGRLAHAEVQAAIEWMLANGYSITVDAKK